MKKLLMLYAAILVLLLSACAPKTVSAPDPTTPRATAAIPLVTTPVAPKVSPEEAEWQKVVEAAKKEGKATIYTWGYIGDTGTQIKNAFKARYGVDLDMVTGRGAEFTERLKTEKRIGNMIADLTQGASVHLLNMKNLDLLEVAPGLPALRSKGDFRVDPMLDKEGYILNENVQIIGPMVNTNLVKPGEEPKSLQEMLDPKWKGKLLAHSPLVSTGTYIAFIPLLNAKTITLDWLRDIGKQDLILTRGDQDTADKLSRGEYPVALVLADTMAGPYIKEGAPIKAIPMAEGITASTLVIAQTKNAPHPNAARLFLDWILSPEGQTVYHKSKSTASVRKDVPDFRPPAVRLPPTAKLVLETASDVSDETKKYVDKWLIELWKR